MFPTNDVSEISASSEHLRGFRHAYFRKRVFVWKNARALRWVFAVSLGNSGRFFAVERPLQLSTHGQFAVRAYRSRNLGAKRRWPRARRQIVGKICRPGFRKSRFFQIRRSNFPGEFWFWKVLRQNVPRKPAPIRSGSRRATESVWKVRAKIARIPGVFAFLAVAKAGSERIPPKRSKRGRWGRLRASAFVSVRAAQPPRGRSLDCKPDSLASRIAATTIAGLG
jgi:hypothetical protein